MIQHKHGVGVPFAFEPGGGNVDEDKGLKQFLDRFDLGKQ